MPSSPVPSPCVQLCRMAADDSFCVGCYRTLAEIAAWSTLSDPDRRQVVTLCAQRRARAIGTNP